MESSDEDEFGTALVRGKISNGVLLIFFLSIFMFSGCFMPAIIFNGFIKLLGRLNPLLFIMLL